MQEKHPRGEGIFSLPAGEVQMSGQAIAGLCALAFADKATLADEAAQEVSDAVPGQGLPKGKGYVLVSDKVLTGKEF